MRKIIRLFFLICVSFVLYSIIVYFVEKINPKLIFNTSSPLVLSIIIIGVIILIIILNKSFLKNYLTNLFKVLELSCLCSIVSTLCIFIVRIILTLIFSGLPGIKESISWFLIAVLVGFICLFIIYFISLLLAKKLWEKE